MNIKVLLIDFKDDGTRGFIEELDKTLQYEGFKTKKIYWGELIFYCENTKRSEPYVKRAVEAAKTVDVAFIHFGSIPRGRASEILSQIKATGVKVIISSVSPVLFEEADYVFSIGSPSKIIENIKRLAKERGQG